MNATQMVLDDLGASEALAIALETVGATVLQVNRTGEARIVIEGAPGLTAVMASCLLDLTSEQPLLGWVAEHRPMPRRKIHLLAGRYGASQRNRRKTRRTLTRRTKGVLREARR